jgi:hypothetical protein
MGRRRELWIAGLLLALVLGASVWVVRARRATSVELRDLVPADATGFVAIDLERLGGELGAALLPFPAEGNDCAAELSSRLDQLILFTARDPDGGMGDLGVIASGRIDRSVRQCLEELGDRSESPRRRVADVDGAILVAGEPAAVDAVLVRAYREATRLEERSPARREDFDRRDVVRLWVELPDRWRRSLRDRADESVFAGVTDLRASIRVEGGSSELHVTTRFSRPEAAERAAREIERLRELALDERALPAVILSLARRLSVERDEASVRLRAEVSATDLVALRALATEAFGPSDAPAPERPRITPDETLRANDP